MLAEWRSSWRSPPSRLLGVSEISFVRLQTCGRHNCRVAVREGPDEDVIDDVSISTVHVLISCPACSLKAEPPRNSGGFLPRLMRSAVIYGVISKTTPQPCCTVLQLRLPPRNVVPYKLPLASTMMFP